MFAFVTGEGTGLTILEEIATPELRLRRVANEFELSWESGSIFKLQQTSAVAPEGSWGDVSVQPGQTQNMFSVRLPFENGNMFFRLEHVSR